VAGFIVLSDGRAFALRNWAVDVVLRTIAAALPGGELAEWVLAQQSTVVGAAMTNVDVRELTPANAQALIAAIRRVAGDVSSYDLPADVDWAAYFRLLADMADAAERGEPPEELNPHMRDVLPPTGERSGPGWPPPARP
jgi:hypothetical protein